MMPWQIFIFSIALFSIACQDNDLNPPDKAIPKAQMGVIDLREWNFEKDGAVVLEGEWEFYWKEFIEPRIKSSTSEAVSVENTEIPTLPKAKQVYAKVVGTWDNIEINGEKIGPIGFASYRLRVLLPDPPDGENQSLAIKLGNQNTSYRMYQNGELVSEIGKVGASKEESSARYYPQVVQLNNNSNLYDLVFHFANFDYQMGGFWNTIKIGTDKQLIQERDANLYLDLFIFGALVIMGIYHLGLFALRPKDKSTLNFGLFSILMGFRTIVTGDSFLYKILPNTPWELGLKIEYLSFYVGAPIFLIFLGNIFPKDLPKLTSKILITASYILSFFVLILPSVYFTSTLQTMQILILGIALLSLYTMIVSIRRRRQGAKSFFVGACVFVFLIINDILYANQILNTGLFATYGFLIFIFSQSFVLSTRFARAYNRAEVLTHNLEKEVLEQTHEINKLNEFTKLINSTDDAGYIFKEIYAYLKESFGINSLWTLLIDERNHRIYSDKDMTFSELSENIHAEFFQNFNEKLDPSLGTLFKTFVTSVPLYLKNTKYIVSNKIKIFKNHLNGDEYSGSKIDLKIILAGKLESIFQLPLVLNNATIGILNLHAEEKDNVFTNENIEKLIRFSDQIAGVIHNSIIQKERKQAQDEVERLNEFSKLINSTADFNIIFNEIFSYLAKSFHLDDLWILLVDPIKGELMSSYALANTERKYDMKKSFFDDFKVKLLPNLGTLYHTYSTKTPLVLNDLTKVLSDFKKIRNDFNGENFPFSRLDLKMVKHANSLSLGQFPLIVQNEVIGIMGISSQKANDLSRNDIDKIIRLSEQIAGVVHNVKLLVQTEEAKNLAEKEREKAEISNQELELQKKELEKLNNLIKSLNEELDLKLIMEKVLNYVNEKFGIQFYALYNLAPEISSLELMHANFPTYMEKEDIEKVLNFKIPIHNVKGVHAFACKAKKTFFLPKVKNTGGTNEENIIGQLYRIKSIIILPLILNNQIIGTIDFSSENRMVLSKSDITSLSILVEQLAGIIHGSNLLKQVQEEKAKAIEAHKETERALVELNASQEQLVQSEKLAALGNLVAGIAHEINTPIGAIKATASNLKDSLGDILRDAPRIIKALDNDMIALAEDLILSTSNDKSLSMREKRKIKSELTSSLEKLGALEADEVGDLLTELGETEVNEKYLPLWKHNRVNEIIKFISSLSGLKSKSDNINMAVEKTVKIIYALKAYTSKDNSGIKQATNLHEGIETVLTIYHNYLKQGIEVVREFGEIPKVLCFESDINQIWTNLTFNAIQAMGAKGKLTIRSWAESADENEPNKVYIQFEDNGPGIPKDVQPKIFDAFYTTKREGEGSGMGLFIVKQIVDKHNGSIAVESEPGRTVFKVGLPVGI